MKDKTRIKIKFDNKVIEKIKIDETEFSYINKEGKNKFTRRKLLPFDVPKKSILKGLKLCIHNL